MKDTIALKTSIDVAHIRKVCRLVEETFQMLREHIVAGNQTARLDQAVEEFVGRQNAKSALTGYKGFPKAICTSVNNVAAHGIPGDYVLQEGDVVSVDITLSLEGWHGDGAWTYVVGEGSPDTLRLVKTAWKASMAGIAAIRAGARLGDVGAAISRAARAKGCKIIENYVGHGIGENMHEDPMVPNCGKRGQGMRIVPGMVFTVEPIVSLGEREVKTLEDGWTIVTADGSLCAQFEHTLAVFRDQIDVLTLSSCHWQDHVDQPPFF